MEWLDELVRAEMEKYRPQPKRSLSIDAGTLAFLHDLEVPGYQRPYVGISARYKLFKREVDLARKEFERLGATVIQPEYGDLMQPTKTPGFFPIGIEEYFTGFQVQNQFLKGMNFEDIHYFECPDGSLGVSTSMEIGFAVGIQNIFPPYVIAASQPLKALEEPDFQEILNEIPVLTPLEAVKEWRKRVNLWKENIESKLSIIRKS